MRSSSSSSSKAGWSRSPRPTRPVLSAAQKRMFVQYQLDRENTSYNVPGAVIIEGKPDKERVEKAFQMLVKRHEAFRTSFHVVDGEPVQKVHPCIDFKIVHGEACGKDIDKLVEEFVCPFDLSEAPLIRVGLFKLAEDEHVMIYDMHHIISDGTSMVIVDKEFAALYSEKDLPELTVQYKDFSVWQADLFKSKVLEKQEQYWMETFKTNAPVLNMPTDYPRPAVMDFKGTSMPFKINENLTEGLKQLAARKNTTLFSVMFAAYNILLSRFTGQDDIVVGVPVAGRGHAGLENIVGMFINTVVIRCRPEPDKTFTEFLNEVSQNSVKAFENQDYQFEMLLERLKFQRDPGRTPMFDTVFNFRNMDSRDNSRDNSRVLIDGLKFSRYRFKEKTTKFDIGLVFCEVDGAVEISLSYRVSLFKEATLEYLMGEYVRLLELVVMEQDKQLRDYDIFSPKYVKEKGYRRNIGTNQSDFTINEAEDSIISHFEARVKKFEQRIAVKTENSTLTYGELNNLANIIASNIMKIGSTPVLPDGKGPEEQTAAMLFRHGTQMIAGIVGILKSGRIYVPLDPSYPPERLQYILHDSKSGLIITDKDNLSLAEKLVGEAKYPVRVLNIDSMDSDAQAVCRSIHINPDQHAYILYTSGSTGTPKGVVQTHRNILHFTRCYTNALNIDFTDKLALFTSYSHTVAAIDIFSAILNGAAVYPYDIKEKGNMGRMANWIMEEGITIYHSVPTVYRHFMDTITHTGQVSSIRAVVVGGEAVYKDDTELYKKNFPDKCIFVNLFGSSEVIIASSNLIDKETEISGFSVPAGYPVEGVDIFLLNDQGEEAGVYGAGEMVYKSRYLSPGYWNMEEYTARTFSRDKENEEKRIYRSRDTGRLLPDGSIEYIGRKDFQVKIRGYRVETGEIETKLLNHGFLKEAAVIAKMNTGGDNYLCAYFTSDREVGSDELKQYLGKDLPHYMIPAFFMRLQSMPLTENGKIDRMALQKIYIDTGTADEYEPPVGETEMLLENVWKQILDVGRVGVKDSFFDLGGNSMLAIKLEVEMEKAGVSIKSGDVYRHKTIRELASFIKNGETSGEVGGEIANITFKKDKPDVEDMKDGTSTEGKALAPMEPFNEVFYRSCFLNSLFPVLKHFNKSIIPFLINDTVVYSYKRGEMKNIAEYLPVKPVEKLLEEADLSFSTKTDSSRLVEDIISAISKGCPVIVWIDCFYLPVRMDMYRKNHWDHCILVYGYDDKSETLNIIEHRHKDNLSYEKRVIKYRDLIDCCKGYLDNFYITKNDMPCYFEFYTSQENPVSSVDSGSTDEYRRIFSENMLKKKDTIFAGLETLKAFSEDFRHVVCCEPILIKNAEGILAGLNDLINAKQVERYRLNKLFGEGFGPLVLLDGIIDKWFSVRKVVAKYVFSSVYKEESMIGAAETVSQIHTQEYEYNEILQIQID